MDPIWKRVRRGQHTACIGQGRWTRSARFPGAVFRVDCAARNEPGGALRELALQLGLGVTEARGMHGGFSEWLHRALGAGPPSVVVFEHAGKADQTTVAELTTAFDSAEWLVAPLVLCFDEEPTKEPHRQLLAALQRAAGEDSVLRIESQRAPEENRAVHPVPEHAKDRPFSLDQLGTEELRVARVAATLGDRFDVERLSQLVDRSPVEVLELLQRASDAGLPLADHGNGCLVFPRSVASQLRFGLLPSLQKAYWKQLHETELPPFSQDVSRESSGAPHQPDAPVVLSEPGAKAIARDKPIPAEVDVAPTAPGQGSQRAGARDPSTPPVTNSGVAAQLQEVVASYLVDAKNARERGALGAALDLVQQIRTYLEGLGRHLGPSEMNQLRVELLLEEARLHFYGAGTRDELTFRGALDLLEGGRELLNSATTFQAAEFARIQAQALYEVGNPAALEAALLSLNNTSRALLSQGHAREAARLLNDEAAIWIRIGDPVRANHLLEKSQEIFENAGQTAAPNEQAELAATWHRFARLILHVAPRPEKERASNEVGIEYATKAAAIYQRLHDMRELSRCWETAARLRTRNGDHQAALAELQRALDVQNRISDAVGLARTSSAAAELLQREGYYQQALDYFEQSMDLNLSLGSYAGLEYNRDWLERFAEQLPAHVRAKAQPSISRFRTRLAARMKELEN